MKLEETATDASKLSEEVRAVLASRVLHGLEAQCPAQALFHEHPAKSKFLAVSLSSYVARAEACPRSSEESSSRKGDSLT